MPYGVLAIECRINTKPVEQGVDFMDNILRTLARTNFVISPKLDSKGIGTQIGAIKRTIGTKMTMPMDINVRVNGLQVVVQQSNAGAKAVRAQDKAARDLERSLKSLESKGYSAFAGVLRGANDADKALERARAKLADIGRVRPAASNWNVSVGGSKGTNASNAIPVALAAAQKAHNAEIQRAVKFTSDFNAHLGQMQGLLSGAAAKSGQLSGALSTTGKAAVSTGQNLSVLGAIGGRVFMGLINSARRFATTHLLFPALYKGFAQIREATVDYNVVLTRAQTSLTALLKGNAPLARHLRDELEQLAIRTPYSFKDLISLAPQLIAAKVPASELKQTFISLGDAAAATGKGTDGLKNMAADLLSLSARGKVTGQDIRNFGNNGVNIVEHLAKAYSTILPKGTKAAEMALRSMITKGLIPAEQARKAIIAGIANSNFAGQMAAQAKTYEGAMSNIGDAIDAVLGGKAFAPTFQLMTDGALKFVSVVSSPKFIKWAEDLAPKLRTFAEGVVNIGAQAYVMGEQLVGAITWAASVFADKLPYIVGGLAVLSGPRMLAGLKTFGNTLMLAFGKASVPILLATGAVLAFIAAYRNFSFVQDFTEVVVGGTLTALKGLSFGFQKIRGEIGAIVQGAGWVMGNQSWIDFGKSQQGLEKGTAKFWDGIIEGWRTTGNKKTKALLTSDYGKMLKGENFAKSLFGDIKDIPLPKPPAIPNYGWGDTNKNNKEETKEQRKALQELAKFYDKAGKAAEDSAKRQLDAMKSVRDTLQDLFGSMQSELAKFGIFNSPLDGFIKSIERLTNFGEKADDVVTRALARMKAFGEAAQDARQQSQSLDQNMMRGAAGTGSGTGATSRILTTFKTREEMLWTNAFKDIAHKSTRVQELVRTQFQGSWDKMFAAMGNTSLATRKHLVALAAPSSSESVERLANPSQWSTERWNKLVERFMGTARLQVGPRASVPTIAPRYANGTNEMRLSQDTYDAVVQRKARDLAQSYLRKIGELQTVTTTTTGWPKDFDFGTIKRTQQRYEQRVNVAGGGGASGNFPVSTAASAGTIAGGALIENLVKEFNDKSPRKLGASCADVASNVLNTLGEKLKYSANAAQLKRNALAAGWVMVPLGTPGALHIQSGKGFGKISGAHTTVGVGDGMVAGSSGYKFQKYKITGAKGNPVALMPAGGVASLRVPSFARNMMGLGDEAALQTGDGGPQAFLANIQDLLKSLNLSKLSLPKEWGKPITDAAGQAHMFQAQMLLANEATQNMMRALLGDKFPAFVKRVREGTYAVDKFLTTVNAKNKIKADIEQGIRDRRARGQENNPYFELDKEYMVGGKLTVPVFQYAKRAEQIRSDVVYQAAKAFEKLKAAEADRLTVVKAGKPFIQGATVDLYKYTRAIQLAQNKLEYARSEGMVRLFQGDKREFNKRLREFVSFDAQRYDQQKGEERGLAFATSVRDMDRRLAQLQAEQKLVGDLAISEGALSIEIDKQGYYFGQLWQLRDAGHEDERSIQLARQLTAQNALNAALERAIATEREWKKSVEESVRSLTLNAKTRGLYGSMRGGPVLDRALFEAQTRSELEGRYNSGEFDVPTNLITTSLRSMRGIITAPQIRRDPYELEKRVQQALQNFDDRSKTDRVAELNARWTQMENDLLERRAELERPLSELDKARFEFKVKGVEQSMEELGLQQKILGAARQLDDLATVAYRKQQGQQFQMAGIFDPNKRADLQLRFEHPEWSEEVLNQMLPVDRLLRRTQQMFDGMNSLFDDWKGSFQGMWRDIAQKGEFSLGSLLDNMTNRLAQWGADLLSSKAWEALQGLLTSFAGGILRTGMGSSTVKYADPSIIQGPPTIGGTVNGSYVGSSMTSSAMMMQAAREISGVTARATSAAMGAGALTNLNFYGENHWAASTKSEVAQEAQGKGQSGATNSRRTVAKQLRRGAGLPS